MDVDPLADTAPPRYNVESDEEEDEENPLGLSSEVDVQSSKIDVVLRGDVPVGNTLIVASGDVGKYWAKGAQLGEQIAGVYTDKIQVGLAFAPSWTKATVIISEALSRLPLWAMAPYVQAIIDQLKPTSVALLDSYTVPTYATDAPTPYEDAPLRYLSTEEDPFSGSVSPFAPPNLLQGTTASFLTLLSTSHTPTSALLLPSPHTPPPAPKKIASSDFSHLENNPVRWSAGLMDEAQILVLRAVGEAGDRGPRWEVGKAGGGVGEGKGQGRGEVGEGGMYI